MKVKYRRKVQKGTGTGRKIGFPTINLNVGRFGEHVQPGVYKCTITYCGKAYPGMLYFGPRLNHPGTTLEIYIVGFNQKIYGQHVTFTVHKKIRKPRKFTDLGQLQKQIKRDLLV